MNKHSPTVIDDSESDFEDLKNIAESDESSASGIILSEDQERALDNIMKWWKARQRGEGPKFMTLGGYAGTGKTTIMAEIRKAINAREVNFMALTGKASLNMSRKLSKGILKGGDQISTIHKFLYQPVIDEKTGQVKEWKRSPTRKPNLIIVDEASMLGREIWEDLLSLGVPILAVGDHGQLPPVSKGDPFNLMASPMVRLEKIHRQAEDSPIVRMSMMAREGKPIPLGMLSNTVGKTKSFAEFQNLLEEDEFKAGELYVLTDLNRRRVKLNEAILIRFGILPGPGSTPKPGSRLICLKNNTKTNPPIFNGMHTTLLKVHKEDSYNNFSATLLSDEGDEFYLPKISKLFFLNESGKAPEDVSWKTIGEQFDYGYAMTVHKAQGSEADRVFVFGTGFGTPEDRARWLYTAITRARKELYICGDVI
jgi:exodeoxyribonuclease-5